jgi:hypothetical protein
VIFSIAHLLEFILRELMQSLKFFAVELTTLLAQESKFKEAIELESNSVKFLKTNTVSKQ